MKKEISILIDEEEFVTYTNFEEKYIADEYIYAAIAHLSMIMKSRKIDMPSMFQDILEDLDSIEIVLNEDMPKGLLN